MRRSEIVVKELVSDIARKCRTIDFEEYIHLPDVMEDFTETLSHETDKILWSTAEKIGFSKEDIYKLSREKRLSRDVEDGVTIYYLDDTVLFITIETITQDGYIINYQMEVYTNDKVREDQEYDTY